MAKSWQPDASGLTFDKGFWAKRPNMEPDHPDGTSKRGSNAFLENGNFERVFLWVNEVKADFALAGSTAQSKSHRSFYPHNLVQPTISISGQMPNTYQYNRLGAYIRDSQKNQVQGIGDDGGILYLRIFAGGTNTQRDIQRGRRKQISVDGYIQNATAGAERFVNAPTFQFNFIITRAYKFSGLDDDPVAEFKMKQILDMLPVSPGTDTSKSTEWVQQPTGEHSIDLSNIFTIPGTG